MIIEFSERAVFQIEEIVRFIAADKPAAARKWAEAVQQSVMKLEDFPYIGRIVPEFVDESVRELLYGEYRIIYKIDEKLSRVVITSLYHARRLMALD
ncbi:MAG: type II toxin-antitoxin system RelE/ParE family toxin [Chlorobium sp.]|nr:MAG: type II toxin-antitoxin system RelE/ParE family toxin [Chlorobium sp.]